MNDTDNTKSMELKSLSAENSRLGNECRETATLLARRELELAECKYHLKTITSMHEDIVTSTAWKCIKPFRSVLNKIKKIDYSAANAVEFIKRVTFKIVRKPVRGMDWVEAVNGSNRKIAIVLAGDDPVNLWTVSLASFLAGHGYLVIYAVWQWKGNKALNKVFSEVGRDIIQIPFWDLVNNSNRIRLQKDRSHICFITFPAQNISRLLPFSRLAGFSIVYNILADWERLNAAGQAVGYEKVFEEQVVMYADMVAVMSTSLKYKFSSLRSDIVTLGNGCSPDSEDLDRFLERGISDGLFSQMIAETENKSVMRNIYA